MSDNYATACPNMAQTALLLRTYSDRNYKMTEDIGTFMVSIDYVLRSLIRSLSVEESGANVSDHRPVIAKFALREQVCSRAASIRTAQDCIGLPVPRAWRWDKADLAGYYEATRVALASIKPPSVCLACELGCKSYSHQSMINKYYAAIVNALYVAAVSTIPRIKVGSNKPYWNDELDRLKADSVFWYKIWLDAGRPASGVLHYLKVSTHLKYKLAVREAYCTFEAAHDDAISSHWLNKQPQEFWKAWHAKFTKRICSRINFPNCDCDSDVANHFATHFNSVYYDSSADVEAVNNFYRAHAASCNDYTFYSLITVDLIDSRVRKLHLHKASGPDDLAAEHLLHAHPSLIIHLKLLFSLIFSHHCVPDAFGQGIIVPLVKDKSANLNNVSNYRPITLTPVISKVFEVYCLTYAKRICKLTICNLVSNRALAVQMFFSQFRLLLIIL